MPSTGADPPDGRARQPSTGADPPDGRARQPSTPVGPRRARTRPPVSCGRPDGHFAGGGADGELPVWPRPWDRHGDGDGDGHGDGDGDGDDDTRLTPIPIRRRRPKHPQNYGFNPWCKANGANLIPLSPRAWEKGGVSFVIFFFFKAKTKYSDMEAFFRLEPGKRGEFLLLFFFSLKRKRNIAIRKLSFPRR